MRLDFNDTAADLPVWRGADVTSMPSSTALEPRSRSVMKSRSDNAPGSATGPTRAAVGGPGVSPQDPDSLYNQDPGAYWDPDLIDRASVASQEALSR